MSVTLTTILIFMPLILAVFATAVFVRVISRRILFFFTATLTMLGLQGIIAPAAFSLLSDIKIYGLADAEPIVHSLLVATALQIIVGIPFLWWLAGGLRNPNPSFKRDA